MRLVMVGLDYTTAGVEIRDVFSPDADRRREILRYMLGDDVTGCALVATCNRTELYISHRGDPPPDGVEMLCRALGRETGRYAPYFAERSERQAVEHLMRVAGGMHSSVPGDDQIITQVRTAIEAAREAETADPLLEALFRSAIAAGKKVKTNVSFARDGSSIAQRAVDMTAEKLGTLSGKRALVIGNGTIGCLTAAGFAERGCTVAVTLRDPRRRPDIPACCADIDFADRYRAMEGCDVVVSATSSPQYTLTLSELEGRQDLPGLFVDLAVPRDIDPAIGGLDGATLLNVDDLRQGGGNDEEFRRRFAEAEAIVKDEAKRFDLWRRNQRRHTRVIPGAPDFPIFINLHRASVLIAGGGKVAARRAEKLLGFGASVHVVSPEIAPEMAKLLDHGGLRWTREEYESRHMDGVTLAIAATDSRQANQRVGRDARERGILVSVADKRQECTFYFPAIVRSDCLTAGVISNNSDHALVKRAATRLREEMETIDAEYQGGEPREPVGHCPGRIGHGGDTAVSS